MNKKLSLRSDALLLRKETLRRLDPSLMTEVQGAAAPRPTDRCSTRRPSVTTCSANTSRGG